MPSSAIHSPDSIKTRSDQIYKDDFASGKCRDQEQVLFLHDNKLIIWVYVRYMINCSYILLQSMYTQIIILCKPWESFQGSFTFYVTWKGLFNCNSGINMKCFDFIFWLIPEMLGKKLFIICVGKAMAFCASL